MERHFHCTACGKCCSGWIPLTLEDALKHAGRFPLALIWTPLRQGAKAYDLTARQGTTLTLSKRKKLALQIAPTAYIPPALSCPELQPDNLCSIHDDKPLRCRTMPFSPYREENDQAELLIPKPDWLCDTSDEAPVVYRDKRIVERADFERERGQLLEQAKVLKVYADHVLKTAPNVVAGLEKAAKKPRGGYVVVKFSGILPRLPDVDTADFARRQLPVLEAFAGKTADLEEVEDYHAYYRDSAAGLAHYLERG